MNYKWYLWGSQIYKQPIKTSPANISTLFRRWFYVEMTSRRRTTSNQRWNNVAYVNVGIYNVEQRRINVVYFNVDLNNVRQRRNNVVIFNVDLHNVEPRRNNVVNMTIKNKLRVKNIMILLSFNKNHLNRICWTQNLLYFVPVYNREYMKITE